ncbi:MAG: hypothetical protein AAFY83_00500, partial [Pseudomonadota bacterium]
MKNRQEYVRRNLYTGALVTFSTSPKRQPPFRRGRISPFQPDETGETLRVMDIDLEIAFQVPCQNVDYIAHDQHSHAPDIMKPPEFR